MLIGIVGKMGQGKTLSMTILSLALKELTKSPLYANYTLNDPDYIKINSLKDIWKAEHGILLLDELWLTMDSRLWKDNVALTQWLNQTRKKDLLVFYTTQHISQVDIRVRRATDWVIWVEKKPPTIKITFVDYQYGMIGKKLTITNPQKHFGKYDTYEILKTIK